MNDTTVHHETHASPTSVALRYGLITGFLTIIYTLILYVTELNTNTGLSWLGMLIPVIGIVLAYNAFKKENGGFMSYGQGLGIGTLLATISGLLGAIFNYVYTNFIDTNVMARMREAQVVEMEKKGLSDEQIEQALGMADNFTSPIMLLIIGVLGGAFIGFLISLIVSAIMKNNRPEFE